MENEISLQELLSTINKLTEDFKSALKKKEDFVKFFPKMVKEIKKIEETVHATQNMSKEEKDKLLKITSKAAIEENLEQHEKKIKQMESFVSKVKSKTIEPTTEALEKEFGPFDKSVLKTPFPEKKSTKEEKLKKESKQKMKERKKQFKSLGADEKWIPL